MEDEDLQKHLVYITKIKMQSLNSSKIKGVTAFWKNNTAHISIFFDDIPTENEMEDASDICTEIIAHMPKGMLEDKYIILEKNNRLPDSFLAYKREL